MGKSIPTTRNASREERDEVIDHFKSWLHATPQERTEMTAKFKLKLWRALDDVNGPLIDGIYELRGLDLFCWCKPEACHGDLLLRLANGR